MPLASYNTIYIISSSICLFLSDQCSLKLGPPRNPNKRKSEDNLNSQLKKAPPIGTSLPNLVQATASRDKSATEDVLSIEKYGQNGSRYWENRFRQGWNFKTSSDFESVLHTVKAMQISTPAGRRAQFTSKFPGPDSQQLVQYVSEDGIIELSLAVRPAKKDMSDVMKQHMTVTTALKWACTVMVLRMKHCTDSLTPAR
ncbi:conserved hypothetical protein [Histoplasma capsulatum var. duboisii H88]|uniref:Uncharacterized protein n=2 Tax=Ajellomyces capsulatus TaxID=5037 RepID=F0UBK6_AJEC8|nr:conserved hypothetical protein [Histoplasma capsulatum H143]EGC43062.1 conserved hypothetical protein [Histoplasma capsulatum var. duboisii H88]